MRSADAFVFAPFDFAQKLRKEDLPVVRDYYKCTVEGCPAKRFIDAVQGGEPGEQTVHPSAPSIDPYFGLASRRRGSRTSTIIQWRNKSQPHNRKL